MYEPGMLEIEPAGSGGYLGSEFEGKGGAFLPHSCDEWIIGGPEEIRDLIRDLEKALVTLGAEPPLSPETMISRVPHESRTIPARTPEEVK